MALCRRFTKRIRPLSEDGDGGETSLKIRKNNIQFQKEKEKFGRRLFATSTKRERRRFPFEVVQWRQRNVQKCVMHV